MGSEDLRIRLSSMLRLCHYEVYGGAMRSYIAALGLALGLGLVFEGPRCFKLGFRA